ncbi:MAG TPA: M48 family metallopeptidase [Gemmatimonadales bacterium]|nr:M48 family metallopeptidase [Gemmatimonadales bacterium]
MSRSPSIAARALLAIVLMVGFYALALGLAAALLAVPLLEVELIGRVTGKLTLVAVMGAGGILWAIVPRRDRFEPPGPRLGPEEQPRLFAALREVARATGQAMPAEVYLVPDLNAWVAQRGGVMGIGSRRVMGIGLPILQTLSVSQFRAVLAHEFGHYHGGDTRLGPWVYLTRAAIERTLAQLEKQGSAVLARPFQWYGRTFLRITHAVSRRQEFTADALAARVAGARVNAAALRAVYGAAPAFDQYWSQELVPVLRRGVRPPIAAGFARYLASPQTASVMDASLRQALEQGESNLFDTHPSLAERLAALEALPPGTVPDPDPPAVTLVDDVAELERRLLAFLGGAAAPPLEPVGWEEVGERVWIPFWREHAARHAKALGGLTPADLPDFAADLSPLAVLFGLAASTEEAGADEGRGAVWVVAIALAVALADRGWRVSALPGEEVLLEQGDLRFSPFILLRDLDTGALTRERWLACCERAGIARLDLGAAVTPADGALPPPVRRAWSFVALEFHRLVLNRTYRVIVTDRMICGARVRGIMSSPFSPPGEAWLDPDFYPNPKLERRYVGVDPESPEFLAIDPANFQYERSAVASVEFTDRPKWGMGNVPYSGRIILRLHDGARRELILLGRQPGEAIRNGLGVEPVATLAAA